MTFDAASNDDEAIAESLLRRAGREVVGGVTVAIESASLELEGVLGGDEKFSCGVDVGVSGGDDRGEESVEEAETAVRGV